MVPYEIRTFSMCIYLCVEMCNFLHELYLYPNVRIFQALYKIRTF